MVGGVYWFYWCVFYCVFWWCVVYFGGVVFVWFGVVFWVLLIVYVDVC